MLVGDDPTQFTKKVVKVGRKVGRKKGNKDKTTRAQRQCTTCCKFDGEDGKWVYLCHGKHGRGECQYFHKDGGVKQTLDVKPMLVQK